jgi:hypothetical protein
MFASGLFVDPNFISQFLGRLWRLESISLLPVNLAAATGVKKVTFRYYENAR